MPLVQNRRRRRRSRGDGAGIDRPSHRRVEFFPLLVRSLLVIFAAQPLFLTHLPLLWVTEINPVEMILASFSFFCIIENMHKRESFSKTTIAET